MGEAVIKDQPISAARSHAGRLPARILLGAILGIVTGLVLGERTAVLQPFGDAYGAMLQIAVYPYLLCSLMYGLGRLTPTTARRLMRAGWIPFLFLPTFYNSLNCFHRSGEVVRSSRAVV